MTASTTGGKMTAKDWADFLHKCEKTGELPQPYVSKQIADAIDDLQAKYDRAVEMLESVQWHCVGRVEGRCGTCYRCGECSGYRDDGHEPNCELAAILNESKESP